MLLVHARLRHHSQALVTATAFEQLLKECSVADFPKATKALVDAGCIIPIDQGVYYHIKPAQWMHDVSTSQATTSGNDVPVGAFSALSFVHDAQANYDKAVKHHDAQLKTLSGAIEKAARWRKCIWGGAMLFSGAQLAVISRLTYVDLDWDIMEPVSYFLGTGTSLGFFLYVLKYKRDHSYEDFDRTMLPSRVRRYAPRDFDWNAYEKAKSDVLTAASELDQAKKWASTH
jgi:calcium uniporter protein, mitochondrial